MNIQGIKNHKNTMSMISESLDKSYRKYFEERNKTVEEKVKEAGIPYRVEGNHIIIERGKMFNSEICDSEYKRQVEADEEKQNRYMEEREDKKYKWGEQVGLLEEEEQQQAEDEPIMNENLPELEEDK